MKISTKGRYALTIMLDIAKKYNTDEFVSINNIAEKENISQKYLERIVAILKKKGLVKSSTGVSGGYKLTKAPKNYTIGEIIRAAEENLNVVDCIEKGKCPKNKTYGLWEGLNKELNDYLDNKTLEDYM